MKLKVKLSSTSNHVELTCTKLEFKLKVAGALAYDLYQL